MLWRGSVRLGGVGGVGRSSSHGRSHRAPAARLPAFTRGRPLFSCGEEKTSSHIPRHFWMVFGLVQREFFKNFFMFSSPRSTARRTALSSTPSASATSEKLLPRIMQASTRRPWAGGRLFSAFHRRQNRSLSSRTSSGVSSRRQSEYSMPSSQSSEYYALWRESCRW